MEDLSAISQALEEVLDGQSTDEDGVSRGFEAYFRSEDRAARARAAAAFAELLELGSWSTEEMRLLVLEHTSLVYIPALLPILPDAPLAVCAVFKRIGDVSRPREVVLALNEALQTIEERVEGVSSSDTEDEGEFHREGADYDVLGQELLLVLQTYATVLPRLPNTKSTPTLLTLQDAAISVLANLAPYLFISASREILDQVCRLVESAWAWVQTTTDKGGEQRTILIRFLSLAVTRYTPNIDAHLFEQWFLATYPKYRGRNEPEIDTGGLAVLQHALLAYESLGYSPQALRDLLCAPASASPFAKLAALSMLATLDVMNDGPPADFSLSDQMPVLSAALSGSAIDAGLLRIFAHIARDGQVEFDAATLLIELIMPLASVATAPTTQTALLKLIEGILSSQAGENKMLVLKQLLEPQNPFEHIRIQAVSILRQQITDHPTELLPLVLPSLGSILFTIPVTKPPIAQMKLAEILGTMYPAWLTECASLLWFILDVDMNNASGIRDPEVLATIKQDFLESQATKVRELKGEAAGLEEPAFEVKFILELWDDSLCRADQAIGDHRG